MEIDYHDLGLHKNYLYEVLATTLSKNQDEIIPNTASMGIRLLNDEIIKLTPYPNTNTFKNLNENGIAIINFVDNIYLYALASLKEPKSLIGLTEFPTELYEYYDIPYKKELKDFLSSFNDNKDFRVPYVNQSWAIVICKVVGKNQITKKDSFGETKLFEINLRIYSIIKNRESFKLFNRAENLTLEILILTTRLKIAKERDNQPLFHETYDKINFYIQMIERFGKNPDVDKSLELVKSYISKLVI